MYSLMVLDPDIPSGHSFIGTNELPILHGLTINIQEDDFTSGSAIKPYFGPAPPDPKTHIYYFLLYEQSARLQLSSQRLGSLFILCQAHRYNSVEAAPEHCDFCRSQLSPIERPETKCRPWACGKHAQPADIAFHMFFQCIGSRG